MRDTPGLRPVTLFVFYQFEELLEGKKGTGRRNSYKSLEACRSTRTCKCLVASDAAVGCFGPLHNHDVLRGLELQTISLKHITADRLPQVIEEPAKVAGLALDLIHADFEPAAGFYSQADV